MKKIAEEKNIAYNELFIKTEKIKRNAQKMIHDSVDVQTEKIREKSYRENKNMFDEKLERIKKFAVASISILGIYDMCVTCAWLSDHTSVFVGQTGIVSFFVSLWNMLISIWVGGANALGMAVNALRGSTGDLIAMIIVYGAFIVSCFVGLFMGIYKGLPIIKKNFKKIIRTYTRKGILGYKKAMTISISIISLCFAVLIAECAMLNVITTWLFLSIVFNFLYHLLTYEQGF